MSHKPNTTYLEFLRSPYWRMVRLSVINRDNKKCTKCGVTKKLQVHHKTYKHHRQEHKHLEDLVTLCKKCHKEKHKYQEKKRKY